MLWRCWLGGRKGIRPVKYWVVGYWRGYLTGARCRLAYGPADATATYCLLLQWNPDWFSFLVPAYPGSPGQMAVKRVCVCVQRVARSVCSSRWLSVFLVCLLFSYCSSSCQLRDWSVHRKFCRRRCRLHEFVDRWFAISFAFTAIMFAQCSVIFFLSRAFFPIMYDWSVPGMPTAMTSITTRDICNTVPLSLENWLYFSHIMALWIVMVCWLCHQHYSVAILSQDELGGSRQKGHLA